MPPTGNSSGVVLFPAALHRNSTEVFLLTDHVYNGTGHYVENDEADPNFTDLQTLFLASFATLVPLILSLLTAFAVRKIWKKYRRNRECRSYDGVLQKEDSCDPLSPQTVVPLHTHLLNSDKMKSAGSQLSLSGAVPGAAGTEEVVETCTESPLLYSGSSGRTNHASANGSIITMTLKNNHLIVETEERNDMIENGRETTMRYSAAAQDGVFVVEVQQSLRAKEYSPCGTKELDPSGVAPYAADDQRALVHNPPERFSNQAPGVSIQPGSTSPRNEESPAPGGLKSSSTSTGLAQSTLSLSTDCNINYTYGNQQGYNMGQYGYSNYNGYDMEDSITPSRSFEPTPEEPSTKPKITSAVYKQNGDICNVPARDTDLEERLQAEQMRLGHTPKGDSDAPAILNQLKKSICSAPKFEKLENDLSPMANSNNVNQYENKGFETEVLNHLR